MVHNEDGRWVPDEDDYPSLGDLLARPTSWTEAEFARARGRVRWLREDLAARDHGDQERRRASVEALIARIEAAIRLAESAGT